VGGSIIQFFTKKLYAIAAFYYQRREYEERVVTDKDDTQDDNLLITSATLLYDVSKKISVFVNFSRRENHTNEPLEKYSDNIYSGGLYYSF
jgi:hypothetical protein